MNITLLIATGNYKVSCPIYTERISHVAFSNKILTQFPQRHSSDVLISAMASQITGVSTVCSIVYSCVNQRKHQSSASLAYVRGIHRWTAVSPHKGLITRKMFPFDDVTMSYNSQLWTQMHHNNMKYTHPFISIITEMFIKLTRKMFIMYIDGVLAYLSLKQVQLTVNQNINHHRTNHSGYGLGQSEKALHCNAFSHWLSPCPEWSLHYPLRKKS